MAPLVTAIDRVARRAHISLGTPADATTSAVREPASSLYGLTDRERQILRLLVYGRTNAEIGTELDISPSTAGVHVRNILGKLHVYNRMEAATLADHAGLVSDLPS